MGEREKWKRRECPLSERLSYSRDRQIHVFRVKRLRMVQSFFHICRIQPQRSQELDPSQTAEQSRPNPGLLLCLFFPLL
jgi:hypothetical protein